MARTDNPFETTPLVAALHRAVDAARASMEADGFGVDAMVVVAEVRHPSAPEATRSATGFPMNGWENHVDLCLEAAFVFQRGSGVSLRDNPRWRNQF